MSEENATIQVAVIAGSRRPNRRARAVAEWVCQESGTAGTELTLVDLAEVALPPLAEPTPALVGDYTFEHTRQWSALIDRFDAYVLVTPEYNHSTSAALKDSLDYLFREWRDKAVAFVGYGSDGGVRAVEHLRAITAELGLAGVGPSVALSIHDDFDAGGGLAVRERQQGQLDRMLEGLARWARALRPLRSGMSSDHVDVAPGHGRPSLDDLAGAALARTVTAALIERLQEGLDAGDADLYDSMFAEDLLWGSPYGQVLRGYGPLNTAHRSMMTAPTFGHSRYEAVQVSMPTQGVVIAHVRRLTLDPAAGHGPEFSEMALYVLVKRDGRWWLAAGQNTPLLDKV